jgi:hypothetical protein
MVKEVAELDALLSGKVDLNRSNVVGALDSQLRLSSE